MGEIGAIYLLPKALKSYPKSNKSPNLVTLLTTTRTRWWSDDLFWQKPRVRIPQPIGPWLGSFLGSTNYGKIFECSRWVGMHVGAKAIDVLNNFSHFWDESAARVDAPICSTICTTRFSFLLISMIGFFTSLALGINVWRQMKIHRLRFFIWADLVLFCLFSIFVIFTIQWQRVILKIYISSCYGMRLLFWRSRFESQHRVLDGIFSRKRGRGLSF